MCVDRFPARPYIADGHPANQTAIVNGNVTFSCPIYEDMAPHISWARYHAYHDSDADGNLTANPSAIRLEVFYFSILSFSGDGKILMSVVGSLSMLMAFPICTEKSKLNGDGIIR